MNKVSRDKLRGKPLDDDCINLRPHITTHEFGQEDNRCYCRGLYNPSYEEIDEKCQKCGAFVNNAVPLEDWQPQSFKKVSKLTIKITKM